jgi:dienelactone hydrolase
VLVAKDNAGGGGRFTIPGLLSMFDNDTGPGVVVIWENLGVHSITEVNHLLITT